MILKAFETKLEKFVLLRKDSRSSVEPLDEPQAHVPTDLDADARLICNNKHDAKSKFQAV